MENTGQLREVQRHAPIARGYGPVRLRAGRWRLSAGAVTPPDAAHIPVLLKPAVDALLTDPSGVYLDGTFGRGGHSREILKRLGPEGRLLALDRDPDAILSGTALSDSDSRLTLRRAAFADLASQSLDFQPLHGILLDLGVSSPQLDEAERGFSFRLDGPLDMRMDPDSGVSAAQWLADRSEAEIADALKRWGEERFARRIARAIKKRPAPLTRTGELAELVQGCVPRAELGKHPATRTFQAIRIAVNAELEQLERALAASVASLAPGGRLVVISFHSLEDRLVKRFIRRHGAAPGNRRLPPGASGPGPLLEACGKPQRADENECLANPRARSAIMRVAVRTEQAAAT
ncbi:MAG: 16S rRNA (cytosine(1402)-N(4))-methyltransferase RsmH [Pseudomonadota bacterium]